MKAKDYFKQFNEENQDKSQEWRVIHVFSQMVIEINDIAKMRNAKSDQALISIFKEQNLKCNSFCKMINETSAFDGTLKSNAFEIFIKQEDPNLAKMVWG
jgi:hypothetical protein